jgi:acetyl esterase/lipase
VTSDPHRIALDPAAEAFVAAEAARVPQPASGEGSPGEITEQWVTIATPDHGALRIWIVEPAGGDAPSAAMLYLHGGGWVGGDASTHDGIVRELVTRAGVAVVFPEYALAPEARYPVAVEQAYATALWMTEKAAERGWDPTRVAVGGDSEGATLAIAVVLLALHRKGTRFRQLIAFTPVTDADFDTSSYLAFAEGYGLRRDEMRWRWDQYAADPRLRELATVCPLRADDADLARFPPTLIITAEADVVRDEGEAFAARLRSLGAVSAAVRYEGMIHDFVVLPALKDCGATRAATAQAAAVLRAALD